MSDERSGPRRFTLDAANALLPELRQRTEEAVVESERLAEQVQSDRCDEVTRQRLSQQIDGVVARWASDVQALGLEVKGLWLVDFDNGEGYYCWKYPEERVSHFHGYEEGFAGRIKIV